ncbi:Imm61 family immunity protein [Microbacterium sp. AZCO]|uniref:Imm61 family immunity protein n=1 Tax=Microbacterium sp. AZCO TaxID=3142976 RepID=UPI0031F3ED9E
MNGEFEAWAAEAGYEVFREPDSIVIASVNGGEIRYEVTVAGEVVTVTRAERAEDPAPQLRSTDVLDAERYLTAQLGIDLRSRRELPRLSFPYEPEDAAPGFHFEKLDGGWATLLRSSGEIIPAALKDTSMNPVVRFSYYVDASTEEIRRSFADPSGAPLFTFVV